MVPPAVVEPAAIQVEPAPRAVAVPAPFEFLAWAALTLVGLLLALAGLILWRRLAGALDAPLPAPLLGAAGALAATLAAGARLAWRGQLGEAGYAPMGWAIELSSSVALVALGVAWSLPGSSAPGLAALWGVIVAEEAWALGRLLRRRPPRETGRARADRATPLAKPPARTAPPSPAPREAPLGDDVLQQLTRAREADGSDRLSGWARVAFAPGQRTESVHLAFCPPFERAPGLEVHHRSGPDVRVKTGQLLPYGARLDLKLAATAERPEWVLLELTAEWPPAGSRDGQKPA